MDHTQLKCFISVARTLNFSEAARRNYVSQSTVSRYIRDLEKELGVKLFERTRREVALTNEGKLLLPYAKEIIDTLNKATSVISQLNSGCSGRLSLAYESTCGEYPIKCLERFSKKYPRVCVDMVQLSGTDTSSSINNIDYDFYFMPRDMLPENDSIVSVVTHRDTLSLLFSSKEKISGAVDSNRLKNQKFVLLSESENPILYMEIMDIFRTFHIAPQSVTVFSDIRSVIMAVRAGMGISVLPTQLIKSFSCPGVRVRDFEDIDTSLVYVVAWHRNISNPAAHLFLETVIGFSEGGDEEEYFL